MAGKLLQNSSHDEKILFKRNKKIFLYRFDKPKKKIIKFFKNNFIIDQYYNLKETL
jgi:hypothetical protein